MEIDVPEEIEINWDSAGSEIVINGPNGEVSRKLSYPGINLEFKGDKIIISHPSPSKKEKAVIRSFSSHIRNAIKGVLEGFEYKLKVVYAHFPINVGVEEGHVVIENFLGESHPRKAKIIPPAEVDIEDEEIFVRGPDKDAVGQTASNIERETKITGKDPRRFQDGIYITSRGD